MSRADDHDPDPALPDPKLHRALTALERPPARPEFRAALRERFLAGAAHEVAPAAPAPRRRLALLAGALAAAAALVVTLFLTRPRAAVWQVHAASTATAVLVDGIAFRLDDPAPLVEALGTARELEVQGGTLRLGVRDEVWIELADDARLSQMKFAAAGPYQARAERGSLRVATLPAFGGRGMRVTTADFDLQVTGTVFGVDVSDAGSCLCTLAGSVRCDPTGAPGAGPVAEGRMCFVYRDGAAPLWGAAHARHLEPLRHLVPGTPR